MHRIVIVAVLALVAACGNEGDPPPEEAGPPDDGAPVSDPATGGIRPADGVYPFQGLWANAGTDCAAEPGSAETAPIEITVDSFVGYENECAIVGVDTVDEADARYRVRRICSAEGQTVEDVADVRVSGDLLLWQSGDDSVTWERCPSTDANDLPARAAATPRRLRGRWVIEPDHCALGRDAAMGNDAAGVILTGSRYITPARSCRVGNVMPLRPADGWRLDLFCGTGGATAAQADLLIEGDRLEIYAAEEDVPPLTRCAAGDDAWWLELE